MPAGNDNPLLTLASFAPAYCTWRANDLPLSRAAEGGVGWSGGLASAPLFQCALSLLRYLLSARRMRWHSLLASYHAPTHLLSSFTSCGGTCCWQC